jgi:hypothetical protein
MPTKAAPKKKRVVTKEPEKVLVLRSCRVDGGSHNGWKYPLTEGAVVEAPDWNPKAECGGGFHGLLWGQGSFSLMCWDDDAWFQVFECDAADVVKIGEEKCKFRRGTQVFVKQFLAPGFALAQAYISANDPRPKNGGEHSDVDSGSASASGDYGSASASGNSGSASASGKYGRASASGKQSIAACIGYEGRAMAGEDGCLIVAWHDGKRPRVCVGYVGEDGIEAGKWYGVKDGRLHAAE